VAAPDQEGDLGPSATWRVAHSARERHPSGDTGDERRLLLAFALTAGFMGAEIVGGLFAGSLALLADAGHMLTDAASLGLALVAARAARRPPTPARSYGHDRFQVLAAFINGATLLAIAGWIVVEAVRRLFAPAEVIGGIMLGIGAVGIVVNIAAFAILHGGSRENINVRGAAWHVLGDLLGSVAAIVAALVILATGWSPIDPLLSVLVAVLVAGAAWRILGESWHVLMEGKPEDVDIEDIRRVIAWSDPAIQDVHHVHVWSTSPGRTLITLHVRIDEHAEHERILRLVQTILAERFAIGHGTVQVERACGARDSWTESTATDATEHA
jgi:cobalt-zinc-cadmium efflux system protein